MKSQSPLLLAILALASTVIAKPVADIKDRTVPKPTTLAVSTTTKTVTPTPTPTDNPYKSYGAYGKYADYGKYTREEVEAAEE
ncbi:hypothetical protein BJ878DRAFT_543203 [Calycina marina]|uniref:Uncharacterized protein n=1 Tax=Calycina marina TaxID=1763456 RepID=A0A9P7Z1R2_9HELO|nr:hypothetical protein BJ878DRAFT_543203 [Calycina marina]